MMASDSDTPAEMPAEEGAHAALVRRWFAGFAAGLPEFEELVDPDIVNHPAPPPLRHGRAHFRRVLDAVLAAAGADGGYAVAQVIAQGDLVCAMTVWRGTHAAPWLGVPATGRPFAAPQAHVFRVADGRLAGHWAVRDDLAFLRQVGAG